MKKNLPISLLILFTIFAALSCNTSYQNLSLQHRSFRIKKTEQKESSLLIAVLMNSVVPDEILTKETDVFDWISGCPAQHFFNDPVSGKNKKGDDRIVNQVGGAGIVVVRLYFEFTKFSGKKLAKSHTISVSQKTGG